uniref:Uncharacterized protein n=1 Tax=Steinernema glaseri TaxID=37863 RepID=A0A1I7YR47_9BILA
MNEHVDPGPIHSNAGEPVPYMTSASRNSLALFLVFVVVCLVGTAHSYSYYGASGVQPLYVMPAYYGYHSHHYNVPQGYYGYHPMAYPPMKRNIAIGRGDGFRPGK